MMEASMTERKTGGVCMDPILPNVKAARIERLGRQVHSGHQEMTLAPGQLGPKNNMTYF